MSKFIEVTDHMGKKYLLNTQRILAADELDVKWAKNWKEDHDSPLLIASKLVVTGLNRGWDYNYVIETYDQIKAMLM